MKKVGLFFGSFNPLHVGHMILANYMVAHTEMEEVWFVVSPQNPFKERKTLLDEIHRYAIIERAIEDDRRFQVSKIEFSMPKPSYTVDTLVKLQEGYPKNKFSLIMGQDNLNHIHKWKNSDILLNDYSIYVYPRMGKGKVDERVVKQERASVHFVDAPIIEISATEIRRDISKGKDVSWFLPEKAWKYVDEMNFYKNP